MSAIGSGAAAVCSVPRGCGKRVRGGVYAECGLSDDGGMPIEYFIIDPPVKVDVAALGLSPIGVQLIERNGVWHLLDWVGAEHYPNVADFIEETMRFGASRRLPQTLDFSKLSRESRMLLVHSKAWIENAHEYVFADEHHSCAKDLIVHGLAELRAAHERGERVMCAGVWWNDIDDGVPVQGSDMSIVDPRIVTRKMPAFEYQGRLSPDGVKAEYHPAIFLSLPISRFAVVRDPDGGTHESVMEKIREAGHDPQLCDE